MSSRDAVAVSVREYARGIAGGLLFSLPLVYTMEMWWAGFLATPGRLLGGLCATFAMLILYNLHAGLRCEAGVGDVLLESVEEMGIGLVGSAALLGLLGRLTLDMPPLEIIGKVVVEGMVTSIGVSVGTAQLGGAPRTGPEASDQGAAPAYREREPWRHLALAACGAVLFAANVAPTEEIVVLASELPPTSLLALAVLSFVVGAVILHFSDFVSSTPASEAGYFAALRVSVQSYAVALGMSAALLWFFGRFSDATATLVAAQTIVLGFAAMLGASAGRLLLQPS